MLVVILLTALYLSGASAAEDDVEPPPLVPVGQTEDVRPEPAEAVASTWSSSALKHVVPPPADDFTAAGIRRAAAEALKPYGGDYRRFPLAAKAEFLEWALWRYNLSPRGQVATSAILADRLGERPALPLDSDTATWNGTLLSALAWKYAVTGDAETLQRIERLLDGLEFYTEVTGKRGFYARSVAPADTAVTDGVKKFGTGTYTAPDGSRYVWVGEPAKGTYNQLAGGYAALMLHAYADLPQPAQAKARKLVGDLVMHLLNHDYRITSPSGRPTKYGDLTPLVATIGVPFNAQVAYLIVALGEQYPPEKKGERGSIEHQFYRLRAKHHVYYEHPLKSLIRPQRIGANPLVKGMNDRFHVASAAYHSLALEMQRARLDKRELDRVFFERMGQSLVWTMHQIARERNALCNFYWAGILADRKRMEMIVPSAERNMTLAQASRGLVEGVEQLRRFRLDRWRTPGESRPTQEAQWVDAQRVDDFQWKADPRTRFTASGPPDNKHVAAIDFLAAYWLFRLYKLDEQEVVLQSHADVLRSAPSNR